jgi:indolepyruvate ferredoxin oxidoreductase beta subunit
VSADRGNLFLAGVGGQGTLLASEVLGAALLRCGYDVKKSEVHGMAQRGGAVTTHLRYALDGVRSPLIDPGTADLLLAFEKMEALRWLHYLAPGGTAVVNTQEIWPSSVATGKEHYPDRIEERLRASAGRLFLVEALPVALRLGEVRAVNLVMAGAVSPFLPVAADAFEGAIRERLPAKVADVNVAAFRAGRELVSAGG